MSRQHHKRRHRRPTRREPDLIDHVRRTLAADHPLDLLAVASQYLEVMKPLPSDALTGRQTPSRDDMIDSLLEIDSRETTGLLHGIAALLPSDAYRIDEIHRELRGRRWPLPDWVHHLGALQVVEAAELSHVLGDGDNVMVTVEWPDGALLTIVVYIDHNMGTIVKDAFPIPDGTEPIAHRYRMEMDADSRFVAIDPADARARIEQAAGEWEHLFPPLTTETWPACRGIVEMVGRALPPGGTGYVRPEWTERQEAELVTAFLGSEAARVVREDRDTADIVETLLWFAMDYGPGDPLRWSPVSVEILMTDWFPRKVVADPQYMRHMPDVLRALIRFAHAERGIPPHLTEETIDAVAAWEPEYRRAAAGPRTSPLDLILEAQGFNGPFEDVPGSVEEIMLESLARQVGGPDALDTLDTEPVPDEELDWTGIPDDVHERVREVLALTDACCDEMLDVEYRTIVRRLLARVAAGDPQVFRRRARADTAAAAMIWMVGRSNDLFRTIFVKDVLEWFGVKTHPSKRAETFAKAAGLPHSSYRYEPLGDAAFLHSSKRRSMIEWRDRYRQRLREASD